MSEDGRRRDERWMRLIERWLGQVDEVARQARSEARANSGLLDQALARIAVLERHLGGDT